LTVTLDLATEMSALFKPADLVEVYLKVREEWVEAMVIEVCGHPTALQITYAVSVVVHSAISCFVAM
jgi:hypothetical protein